MFVSSPTSSSLILKSIRQSLIEGAINTVNRRLCNYTPNQPNTFTAWLEICDPFDVDMRVNAMNNTFTHVIKQILFRLNGCLNYAKKLSGL